MSEKNTDQKLVDVSGLVSRLESFAYERDWGQFHSPKNLAMALSGEVGELIEIFQWMTEEESRNALRDEVIARRTKEELADVLLYAVRLASVLGVDLDAAAKAKLEINEAKYPVEKSRGSSKKYTEFKE